MLDSAVSGPYRRVRYAVSATTVPIPSVPSTANTPPTPYTRATASAATRVSETRKILAYIAVVTPMSRTRAALPAKSFDESCVRPKTLARTAPATLKRSVIVCAMVAFSL